MNALLTLAAHADGKPGFDGGDRGKKVFQVAKQLDNEVVDEQLNEVRLHNVHTAHVPRHCTQAALLLPIGLEACPAALEKKLHDTGATGYQSHNPVDPTSKKVQSFSKACAHACWCVHVWCLCMLACEQDELMWFDKNSKEEKALVEVLQAVHNLVFSDDSGNRIDLNEIAVKWLPAKEHAQGGVCGDCIQWSWS